MKQQLQNDYVLHGIFANPIYVTVRDSIEEEEKKEIEDIIYESMKQDGARDYHTADTYIFNRQKLKNLKEFIEQHIKNYVKEIINPKEELDFYITQSWLNVIKPGGNIHQHSHPNSIISGVYYTTTVEDDKIHFHDANYKLREVIKLEPKEFNIWNSPSWFFPVTNNKLILFPSWLDHEVKLNEEATTTRISISFNTFIKGNLGQQHELTELIL